MAKAGGLSPCLHRHLDTAGLAAPRSGKEAARVMGCCWFWVQNSQLMVLLCSQFLHSVPLIHNSSMQVVFSHHGYIDIFTCITKLLIYKAIWNVLENNTYH